MTVLSNNTKEPSVTHRLRARKRGGARAWTQYGTAIATLAAVIVFTILNPGEFLSRGNLLTIIDQMAIPLIIICGLTFVVLAGSVDLSIEGVMAAAGLTFVLLSGDSSNAIDLGFAAVIVAVLVGLLFGLVNGLIHTKLRIPSFILTLGTWYVGLGVASILYGSSAPTLEGSPTVDWLAGETLGLSHACWIAIVMVGSCLSLVKWTAFGRYSYAVGNDEKGAEVAGVPVRRFKVYFFAFAGVCSATAGIIGSVRLGAGLVEVGSGQLFFALTAVVVGGTALAGGQGGIGRSVVGVLLLTVLNNGLVLSGADPSIQQALFGIAIIVAVGAAAFRQRSITRVVK
ncbi:ABC transporter permease [Rhodococcus sp. NPDC057529]|uniref:ABC transporter permease n=1 Tax=Rhodococcus sp. NPDC057529 TaxID=3346158 RepID=UPI003672ECE8